MGLRGVRENGNERSCLLMFIFTLLVDHRDFLTHNSQVLCMKMQQFLEILYSQGTLLLCCIFYVSFSSFFLYCYPYGMKPWEACFLKVYQRYISFGWAQVYQGQDAASAVIQSFAAWLRAALSRIPTQSLSQPKCKCILLPKPDSI